MSSMLENQTPKSLHHIPPQSAQPRGSLFGGPSSDVGPDLPSFQPEQARQSIFGGPSSQDVGPTPHFGSYSVVAGGGGDGDEHPDDFDLIMRERPLQADYGTSSESFQDSDGDDDLAPDASRRDRSESSRSRPKTYVLDRGLDLQVGMDRPNRYTGPPSTYRKLTAADRGAAEAIMTNRARDLAAHLFNAYALRKRAREAVHENPDIHEQEILAPFRGWTAWPAPADQVPRVEEAVHKTLDEPGTLRMAPDPRSSAELGDSITAFMMKFAKEKFESRDWDFTHVKSSVKQTDQSGGIIDSEVQNDSDHDPVDGESLRPVVQADDDKSRRQLRPLSRNVISQVDRVLGGLHHSMKGRFFDDDSSSESASDVDSHASRSPTFERNVSRSRSRGRKRIRRHSHHGKTPSGRSRSAHTVSGVDTQDESMRDASLSRSRSRFSGRGQSSRPSTHVKLRMRDWSEVMGVASMVDLPSAAVTRASKRCADLFGQDMAFRTFREGRMRPLPVQHDGLWAALEYEYTEDESESEPQRTRRPASKPRAPRRSEVRQRQRQPPRQPSVPAPEAVATKLTENEPSIEPEATQSRKGKGPHRKKDIVCPLKTCPRHVNGFSRRWNLNLHMKRVHPNYNPHDTADQAE